MKLSAGKYGIATGQSAEASCTACGSHSGRFLVGETSLQWLRPSRVGGPLRARPTQSHQSCHHRSVLRVLHSFLLFVCAMIFFFFAGMNFFFISPNLSSINLVSIFRRSSPPRNPVYTRRVGPHQFYLLVFHHTYTHISILFTSHFISSNKQRYSDS